MKLKAFLLAAMTVLLTGCPPDPEPDFSDEWEHETPSTQPQEKDYKDLISKNVRVDVQPHKYLWDISVTTSLNSTIDGKNVSYIFEFGLDDYYDYFINIPFNGTPVVDLDTNTWVKNVYGNYCSIENVYRSFGITQLSSKRIDLSPCIFLCNGEALVYYDAYMALIDLKNSGVGLADYEQELYYSVCDLLEKFYNRDAWQFRWRIIVKIGQQAYIVKSEKYQY